MRRSGRAHRREADGIHGGSRKQRHLRAFPGVHRGVACGQAHELLVPQLECEQPPNTSLALSEPVSGIWSSRSTTGRREVRGGKRLRARCGQRGFDTAHLGARRRDHDAGRKRFHPRLRLRSDRNARGADQAAPGAATRALIARRRASRRSSAETRRMPMATPTRVESRGTRIRHPSAARRSQPANLLQRLCHLEQLIRCDGGEYRKQHAAVLRLFGTW